MIIYLPSDPIVPSKTFLTFGRALSSRCGSVPRHSAQAIVLAPIPQTFTTPVTVGDVTLTPSSAEVR
jgi:hypothetical protein